MTEYELAAIERRHRLELCQLYRWYSRRKSVIITVCLLSFAVGMALGWILSL